MREIAPPVPGLTRDLPAFRPSTTPEAPARGPGRESRFGNQFDETCGYDAFRLHHGIQTGRRAIRRAHPRSAKPGRGPSRRVVAAYREIQDQDACLVRIAFGFRRFPSTGTVAETVAARLERRLDHGRKPKLERPDTRHSLSSGAEAPAQGRGGCRKGGKI